MVGSDVCGHMGDASEQLCARWTTLGAFSPFYRNHNTLGASDQEFYRWNSTTVAAKKAIEIRYRLLDYIYTAMYLQTVDGTPLLYPLFYLYANDIKTFGIELQYFYGKGLLVSPVTEEDTTRVSAYFPEGVFYDYYTHAPIEGKGAYITINEVDYTSIPLHYRGGVVIPQRIEGAMTTTALRKKDFELIVAINKEGKASGELYLDDGISIKQNNTTLVKFEYELGKLQVSGEFGFASGVSIKRIIFLGVVERPFSCSLDSRLMGWTHDSEIGKLVMEVDRPLKAGFEVTLSSRENAGSDLDKWLFTVQQDFKMV